MDLNQYYLIILWTTLSGIAFGFGCASVLFLRLLTRTMRQLHEDNIQTATLLVRGDAEVARLLAAGDSETARLLASSDVNRASEATIAANTLALADEVRVRKVKQVESRQS